jgi:hypothetical protein
MCVQCGHRAERVDLPRRRSGAGVHPPPDRRGQGQAAIKAALVEEYGPRVLAVPEGGGFDVAAVARARAAVADRADRRRASRRCAGAAALATSPTTPTPGPSWTPTDRRRLDADLAAFDR